MFEICEGRFVQQPQWYSNFLITEITCIKREKIGALLGWTMFSSALLDGKFPAQELGPLNQILLMTPCGQVSAFSISFPCWMTWSLLLKKFPEWLLTAELLLKDQALSLWSGITDSKTLDYQRTNPKEYQIVRTHIKETTWIHDLASPNYQ